MTLLQVVTNVLLSVGVLAAVIFCGVRVVGWARRQQTGAYVVGALFAPLIAPGKVTDPDSRIAMEAKQHKQREDDEPGDPPDPDEDPSASHR